MVEISAPTNQLIQIDATSANAAEAQTLSQAVADSYVGYVSNTAREVTSAALADLKVRRDQLQAQIQQLQNEIAAATKRQRDGESELAGGKKEAQLLGGASDANRPTFRCSSTKSRTRSPLADR